MSHTNIVGSEPISLAQKCSIFAVALRGDHTSFLPIQLDGSKRPDYSVLPLDAHGDPVWSPLEERLPTSEESSEWFGNGVARGIAVNWRSNCRPSELQESCSTSTWKTTSEGQNWQTSFSTTSESSQSSIVARSLAHPAAATTFITAANRPKEIKCLPSCWMARMKTAKRSPRPSSKPGGQAATRRRLLRLVIGSRIRFRSSSRQSSRRKSGTCSLRWRGSTAKSSFRHDNIERRWSITTTPIQQDPAASSTVSLRGSTSWSRRAGCICSATRMRLIGAGRENTTDNRRSRSKTS